MGRGTGVLVGIGGIGCAQTGKLAAAKYTTTAAAPHLTATYNWMPGWPPAMARTKSSNACPAKSPGVRLSLISMNASR